MKTLSIILSSLSAIAIIMAILFEGQIKSKGEKNDTWKALYTSFKSLSKFGIILILISFLMSLGNGINAYMNIVDNDAKFEEDTARNNRILRELKQQRSIDSTKIIRLESLVNNNGMKSDSIRMEVVNNAIKALDEQKAAIERERENVFIHFKSEVGDNLKTIFLAFTDKKLDSFKNDSLYFISTRLNNLYVKKYQNISSTELIIDYLMELSAYIDKVNMYANLASEPSDLKGKNTNINMMKKNVKSAKTYLVEIFMRLKDIKSYKEYENLDFSKKIKPWGDSAFHNYYINAEFIRNRTNNFILPEK